MATGTVIHRRLTRDEVKTLKRRIRAVQEAQDILDELVLATCDGNATYQLDVNLGVITKPKPAEPEKATTSELTELS